MRPKRFFEKCGQSIIEFTFTMMVVLIMLYGTVMILRWVGLDFSYRRTAHERVLSDETVNPDYNQPENGPLKQLEPYFYDPIAMNAIWEGD